MFTVAYCKLDFNIESKINTLDSYIVNIKFNNANNQQTILTFYEMLIFNLLKTTIHQVFINCKHHILHISTQ